MLTNQLIRVHSSQAFIPACYDVVTSENAIPSHPTPRWPLPTAYQAVWLSTDGKGHGSDAQSSHVPSGPESGTPDRSAWYTVTVSSCDCR